jgi:nicotinamidase-related amidase
MTQDVKTIGADAVHVCIDIQRLFAEQTDWHTASIPEILPAIVRLAEHAPERTIFTRFTTPERPEDAQGHWRAYYERWKSVTTGVIGAGIIDLVDELEHFVPPARIADKPTYSAFESPGFRAMLDEMACKTVVCTGVETDVCVLATVMSAMDRGYRVVLASDGVHSSDAVAHRVTLDHVYRRFEDQIEIGTTDDIIKNWKLR